MGKLFFIPHSGVEYIIGFAGEGIGTPKIV